MEGNKAYRHKKRIQRKAVGKISQRATLKQIAGGALVLAAIAFFLYTRIDQSIIDLGWFWALLISFIPFGIGTEQWEQGRNARKRMRRCDQYLSLLIERPGMSMDELGRAVGSSGKQAKKDFKWMIEKGTINGGYFSEDGEHFVLPSGGWEAAPVAQEEPQEPAFEQPSGEGESAQMLGRIQALGKSIRNAAVAGKVSRIEKISAQIFAAVEHTPAKRQQIRTFMNYYLPTTIKMLEAYARYEVQSIKGQNVNAAVASIEGVLDKLVAAFERQLDQLYGDEVLDISAEIDALEAMLAKDGLSGMGMTMPGGSAR